MKSSGTNDRWKYNDAAWLDNSTFNSDSNANQIIDIKTLAYNTLSYSTVRLSIGTVSNNLIETTWGFINFSAFMKSGVKSSTNSRIQWINWINNAIGSTYSWLQNCNKYGTLGVYNFQKYRIGAVFNGENDCSTVDEVIGFGLLGDSPYNNSIASGSFSTFNGSGAKNIASWIFIK